jgi:hypothetical protein
MALLLNADMDGRWPVDAAAFPVVPCCRNVMVRLFPQAGGTCVVLAGLMESVLRTVATHAARFGVLDHVLLRFPSSMQAAADAAFVAVCWVLYVGRCFGELRNLVRHDLDLSGHCIGQCLCAIMDVGGLFFLGNRCLRNPGYVLAQLVVAMGFGRLICTFKFVLAGCAAVLEEIARTCSDTRICPSLMLVLTGPNGQIGSLVVTAFY